jgi:hypothetical protein
VCAFILCLCCPLFRQRPCDELITRPSSPTVCENDHETEKSAQCSKVGVRGRKKYWIIKRLHILIETKLVINSDKRYLSRCQYFDTSALRSVYLSIYLSIFQPTDLLSYLWLYSHRGTWPLFQFLNPIHSR